jgi:hypothetical protein
MKIPSNHTEEEVLEIFDRVANRLAYKFKFGYHDIDDMKQTARLEAWKGLASYDGVRPLENFIWTHVHNRLFNNKRDKLARPDKPCLDCPLKRFCKDNDECLEYVDEMECEFYANWIRLNASKRNIMEPMGITEVKAERETNMSSNMSVVDDIANREIIELIDTSLEVEYRRDWLLLKEGDKIPKTRRKALEARINEILTEANAI